MTHYLVTSTFIDFTEHNTVVLSRIKFKTETIRQELLKKYKFFETASCKVYFLSQYEARLIGSRTTLCNSLEEVIEVFESIIIYQQNKKP